MTQLQLRQLLTALLQSTSMRDRTSRDVLVNGFSPDLLGKLQRVEDDQTDVENILQACVSHPNGMNELISMLEYLEGDSPAVAQIRKTWQEINTPAGKIAGTLLLIASVWLLLVGYANLTGSVLFSTPEILLAVSPSMLILLILLGSIIGKLKPENELEEEEASLPKD